MCSSQQPSEATPRYVHLLPIDFLRASRTSKFKLFPRFAHQQIQIFSALRAKAGSIFSLRFARKQIKIGFALRAKKSKIFSALHAKASKISLRTSRERGISFFSPRFARKEYLIFFAPQLARRRYLIFFLRASRERGISKMILRACGAKHFIFLEGGDDSKLW